MWLYIIIAVVGVFIAWMVISTRRYSRHVTSAEICGILSRFLDGAGGHEFDDFTCIRLRDPRFEAIRRRCAGLPDEFPPEAPRQYCGAQGMEVIRKYIQELEHDAA